LGSASASIEESGHRILREPDKGDPVGSQVFFTLPFIASAFPYVASGPSGFDASTQLPYGQLLAAFVAVSLAEASGSW